MLRLKFISDCVRNLKLFPNVLLWFSSPVSVFRSISISTNHWNEIWKIYINKVGRKIRHLFVYYVDGIQVFTILCEINFLVVFHCVCHNIRQNNIHATDGKFLPKWSGCNHVGNKNRTEKNSGVFFFNQKHTVRYRELICALFSLFLGIVYCWYEFNYS